MDRGWGYVDPTVLGTADTSSLLLRSDTVKTARFLDPALSHFDYSSPKKGLNVFYNKSEIAFCNRNMP